MATAAVMPRVYQDDPPIRAASAMASLRFKTTSADKELLEFGYKYPKRQPDTSSLHSAMIPEDDIFLSDFSNFPNMARLGVERDTVSLVSFQRLGGNHPKADTYSLKSLRIPEENTVTFPPVGRAFAAAAEISISTIDNKYNNLSLKSTLSHATNGSTPSGIGQSRVSLELTGNISIELQTPRVDAPTPLEAAHPGKENLRRARLMSRLIVGLAQGSYPKLDQYFHKFDVDAPYGKKLISQRSPTVFDIRMFIKNPMPSGYFEMIPSYQRNAPQGYVQYRMSKSLTVEDRSLMKDMWGPCLQEGAFLTPSVLYPWIAKGVKKAIKELQGIKIGRSTYGFLLSVKPPEVMVIVRAISEATLVSSVFTLHILPSIMETGKPKISGFHLRMPLPPVLPYSRAGMSVMRQVEAEMEEGKLVWYLEGKHIEPLKSDKAAYARKDRHANCHQHSEGHDHDHDHDHGHGHGKEKKKGGSSAKGRNGKNWVISLESLEKRLLDLSLKTVPMAAARKGFIQFDTLIESVEGLWSLMGKSQITSIKLWTIKRTALRNRTQQDWLRALLRILQETLDKKFGTYFLQPSINFLSETEPKALESLSQAIKDLSEENAANEGTATPSLPKTSTQRTQLVQTPRTSRSKPHNPVAYSWG